MSEKVFYKRSNLKREAAATQKLAAANVRTSELDLEFTRIIAPMDGRISRALVSIGNFVAAGGGSLAPLSADRRGPNRL